MTLILHTERLVLRPLTPDDVDLGLEMFTDPEVTRYVADKPFGAQEIIDEMPIVTRRCARGAIGIWVIAWKDSGERLGTTFLLPLTPEMEDNDWSLVEGDDLPPCEIEIGYILKRSAWGQGVATEACARLLRFAFEDTPIPEIVAVIDPDNHASRRVLLKCGLRPAGLIRAYKQDLPGFRITATEWRADQGATKLR